MTGGAVFGALGSMRKQVLVAGTREGELFDRCPSVRSPWDWPQVHQNLWNTNDYTAEVGPSAGACRKRASHTDGGGRINLNFPSGRLAVDGECVRHLGPMPGGPAGASQYV